MAQSFNEDPIFHIVKSTLIEGSGMEGLKHAVQTFRSFDLNKDNELDPSEWRMGLKKLGVKLTDTQANYLFIAFDANKDGKISIDEFIRNLIGQLNPRRSKVVDNAFQKFLLMGGPNVTVSKNPAQAAVGCDQLLSTFASTTKTNPLVQSGAKSEAQLIREFAMIFDPSRNPNGAITKEDFIGYYAAISTTVPHDDVFEAMLLKAWDVDPATAPRLNTTLRDWSAADGGVDPLYIDKPLLHTQALNPRLADTMGSKAYNSTHMSRQHPPFTPSPSVLPDYISTTKKDFVPHDEQQRLRSDPMSTRRENGAFSPTTTMSRAMAATKGQSSGVPLTGNPLIDNMRRKILEKVDDEGFLGLRTSFYVMDMPRDHSLEKLEARSALQRYKVSVTPIEFEQLWNYVLRDNASPIVTVGDFIRILRGDALNERRLAAIRTAFDYLATQTECGVSDDLLSVAAMAQRFNTSEHPAVRSGKKARSDVIQNFINAWCVDKGRNSKSSMGGGAVDLHQFVDYYEDLSASIEDDLVFELMIKNAWRMK